MLITLSNVRAMGSYTLLQCRHRRLVVRATVLLVLHGTCLHIQLRRKLLVIHRFATVGYHNTVFSKRPHYNETVFAILFRVRKITTYYIPVLCAAFSAQIKQCDVSLKYFRVCRCMNDVRLH